MTALDRALIRAFTREPGAGPVRAQRLASANVVATGKSGPRKSSRQPLEAAVVPSTEPIDVGAPATATTAVLSQSLAFGETLGLLHVTEVGVGSIPALPPASSPSVSPLGTSSSKPSESRPPFPALRFDKAHLAESPAPHRKPADDSSRIAAVDAALSLPTIATPAPAQPPPLGVYPEETSLADEIQPPSAGRGAGPLGAARPLSSFVARPSADPFRPLLEVDNFIWSAQSEQLFDRAEAELKACASKLLARATAGQKVVAITGVRRSEGRTTIVAALARQLALGGASVVVVDADLANPQLAARLGICAQAGWDDVAEGQFPLAESLVLSLTDRFSLAPLRQPLLTAESVAGNLRATLAFGTLREHFDLVLVDAGPILLGEEGVVRLGRSLRLDAAYLVYDARDPRSDELAHAIDALEETGVAVTGLIENFASGEPHSPPARAASRLEPAPLRTAISP